MHEWSITQDLIDEVKRQATQHNIRKVTKIQIAVGKKSDLTPESLQICFEALTGNKIDIEKIPEHHHNKEETSCHNHHEEIEKLVKQNKKSQIAFKDCKLIIKKTNDHKIIINKITGEKE